jgi:hypothetical protein
MDIHRYVSTCFEQPSVDIGLDLSPRDFAQSKKGFLHAVLRSIRITPREPLAIDKQRTFQTVKYRLQPLGIFDAGVFL